MLLITSRDTGRWVIPKGNLEPDLTDAEAAAKEAWEEAGLTGTIDPDPIGTFDYAKRRRSGMVPTRVQVYAFEVAGQADDFPERGQRRLRWFAAGRAVAQVDEPGLGRLIAALSRNCNMPPLARTDSGRGPRGRRGPMLGWFKALLPKQGRFFDQFEEHAQVVAAGAAALSSLVKGQGSIEDSIVDIINREHQADDLAREVLQDVRRVFVTPFDRSAIADLIGVMDDAIDEMNKTASAVGLYEVTEFAPEMAEMADVIVEAAAVTVSAMPLLRAVGRNATKLSDLTERLVRLEGRADDIHARGLKALFERTGKSDPAGFIVGREIYSHLERITDRFEDVANEIQGLVIDHA